eukprot:4594655-Amphidinium_carterae.2
MAVPESHTCSNWALEAKKSKTGLSFGAFLVLKGGSWALEAKKSKTALSFGAFLVLKGGSSSKKKATFQGFCSVLNLLKQKSLQKPGWGISILLGATRTDSKLLAGPKP